MTVKQNALKSRKQILFVGTIILFVCGIRIGNYLFPSLRGWIVCIGIACLFVRTKSDVRADTPLIFVTCAIGLFPMAGWVPGLSRLLDPILLLAAISIIRGICSLKRRASVHWYLIPIGISAYFGTHRWWHFTAGYPSEIMARLYSGWDHFGHFYLFLNSIRFNSFVSRAPELIAGMTSYDRQYPAGIQMSWAQWWPQNRDLAINHPVELLNQYMKVVIITAAVSSILITIAIVRLYSAKSRVVIASALAVSTFLLIFAGPLSITIWNGFPNFLIAIAGVVVVVSLCERPLESQVLQLFSLFAAISITSYNWYPLLVVVGPLVATTLWHHLRALDGGRRAWFVCGAATLGFLSVLPIVGTFAFGVSHLTVDGGITQLPPNIVVFVTGFSLVLGVMRLWRNDAKCWLSMTSPLIVAPLFSLAVAVYVRQSQHAYPYYVQKIAMGVVFICLATLPVVESGALNKKLDSLAHLGKIRHLSTLPMGILFAFCTSQLFGYIGPDWKTLAPTASSPGLYAPTSVQSSISARLRTTNILVSMSNEVLSREIPSRDCFVFDDIDMQDYDPVLTNYWVGVLTWTLTEEHLKKSQRLIPLKTGITDVRENAEVVETLLTPTQDCPIVSQSLAEELISMDMRWSDVLWVINKDGHVSKFKNR